MKRWLRRAVGKILTLTIRVASGLFGRGSELPNAVAACRRFAERGKSTTLGYFNADGESPRAIADASLAALDAIQRSLPNVGGAAANSGTVAASPSRLSSPSTYLSIKAPALRYDSALIGEITDRARSIGVGVHFDSHSTLQADPTFEAIAAAVQRTAGHAGSGGWSFGVTLPGRWKRSIDDAQRAIDLGLRVRIVKGQWLDPTAPTLAARDGVLALVDRLAGRAREVAIGSHDAPLVREAVQRLRRAGTAVEMELLLGLPSQAALKVARELEVPVRMYVFFGVAWLPYTLDHVRKNPYVARWAIMDATVGRFVRPPQLLLPRETRNEAAAPGNHQ